MINGLLSRIMSRIICDEWTLDCLEVEVPPESMVKIDFKQKLWIINMRGVTSPIELYTYRDGEVAGHVRLSPRDFEYRYEKELIGSAKFLIIFPIPIYKLKKKEPLSRLFFPVECNVLQSSIEIRKFLSL